jgi:L-cystine transport system permease protein
VSMSPNNLIQHYLTIVTSSFLPLLEGALYYSLTLTVISFALGLLLAVITALARISQVKILRTIARIYVSIIRGTPLLVQLFIIFYGLPSIGILINPYPSAVIGFTLSVGAYGSEIVRAAILSVPTGQWEASYSLGMNYRKSLLYVILPQASRVSIPPLANSFISLLKDTSLAAVVLVPEMFRIAQQIVASTYEPLLLYSEAAVIYWILCLFFSYLQDTLESKLSQFYM